MPINFWSPKDGANYWPDGIGQNFTPGLDNRKIGKCKHCCGGAVPAGGWVKPILELGVDFTADGVQCTDTLRSSSGETAWLTAYMCRKYYCSEVDSQKDFMLSKYGQWVTPYKAKSGLLNTSIYWKGNGILNYGAHKTRVFHPLVDSSLPRGRPNLNPAD